jgi:hypothetical protein
MKAFVEEFDHGELRALIPEEPIRRDDLGRRARGTSPRSTTAVSTPLDNPDDSAIRSKVTGFVIEPPVACS